MVKEKHLVNPQTTSAIPKDSNHVAHKALHKLTKNTLLSSQTTHPHQSPRQPSADPTGRFSFVFQVFVLLVFPVLRFLLYQIRFPPRFPGLSAFPAFRFSPLKLSRSVFRPFSLAFFVSAAFFGDSLELSTSDFRVSRPRFRVEAPTILRIDD